MSEAHSAFLMAYNAVTPKSGNRRYSVVSRRMCRVCHLSQYASTLLRPAGLTRRFSRPAWTFGFIVDAPSAPAAERGR